jgi:hypothetical protein
MDTVSPARRVVGEMRTGLHSMRPAARCWRLLDATTRMLREAWALTEKSLNVAAPGGGWPGGHNAVMQISPHSPLVRAP